ncbi:MAG: CsbD family protein [Mycobacteriales bacterium]
MGTTTDKVKGRAKQTAGALAGDKKLQRDGRRDERTGATKVKAGKAIDAVRDKL